MRRRVLRLLRPASSYVPTPFRLSARSFSSAPSSQSRKKCYVTAPIFYVNGDPHLGHAYTLCMSDAIARFKELDGCRTFFLTGTDEHGQKVERSAQLEGSDPADFVSKKSKNFKELTTLINCRNDDFIRTTEDRHKDTVMKMWTELVKNDMIYKGHYEGWYSVVDETFYHDRDLRDDGKAPTGADVEWIKEESYFFRLSKLTKRLIDHFDENPFFVVPLSRHKEMQNLLSIDGGLQDVSISRMSFSWGIPVPGDNEHVVYVWLDALINYASAIDGCDNLDRRGLWPPDVQIVGKDILYFHSILWPAILMSVGKDIPQKIVAHGWWMHGNRKMSKSLGNVVDPVSLIQKYGACSVRYFLLSETTMGRDGDFTEEAFVRRINSDLSDNLGNLVHRVLSLIKKNFDGMVPHPCYDSASDDEKKRDTALLNMGETALEECRELMKEEYDLHKILIIIFKIPREANRYIDAEAPWRLIKQDLRRAGRVLYVLVEVIRRVAILLEPFIPHSSTAILDQIGANQSMRSFSSISQSIRPGGEIAPSPSPAFPRHVIDP